MMRFHTAIAGVLGSLLVIPVLAGQGSIATLRDALSGTERAIEVLAGIEQRFQQDPAAVMGLILSATEAESGSADELDRRLESLRGEVNLLQMELDAHQSPVTGADGAVQSSLGAREPSSPPRPPVQAGITTGLDDSLRALLTDGTPSRPGVRRDALVREMRGEKGEAPVAQTTYSADPLRHGITCYRAGRYAEACELLAPLEDASALYWQARALERLERVDQAIAVMERAIAKGGQGFELRRAKTDLEFLRWKRDFLKNLPASPADAPGARTSGAGGER